MYTVITRAKTNLWLYETTEDKLPVVREWIQRGLMDIFDPSSTVFEPNTSFATAKRDTPQQWKLQGDMLKLEKRWQQACFCYRQAGHFDLEALTQAMALESQIELSKLQHLEIASYYFMADEISHDGRLLLEVAKHLVHARLFDEAGWLYEASSKVYNYVL